MSRFKDPPKKQLGGKQIATYIRKAIASKTDFAAQAKKAQQQERQAEQDRADAAFVAHFREHYAGKVLRSADGRETIAIHATGEHAQHQIGRTVGTLPLVTRKDVAYVVEKVQRGLLSENVRLPGVEINRGLTRSAAVTENLAMMRQLVGLRRYAPT